MERAPALVPTQAAEAATRTGGSPGRGTGPRASDAAEPALDPAETYQLDSSAYSDSDAESLPDEEYDALVAEGKCESKIRGECELSRMRIRIWIQIRPSPSPSTGVRSISID